MSLRSGQTLAHYRLDRKIGEGGMGEVWAASDTRLQRAAAIKALPASVAGDPERLARFTREAQVLAALSHPNIAAIYGLEEMDGAPYLAMELVDGSDLSARIERGPIPIDEAADIARQIGAALEEAHDKGIVHRDLKPANVKVTADGKVKVLDFGLAKALEGDGSRSQDPSASFATMMSPAMTQMGMILGTAAYMSPEQARGRPVDRRADIWAFGCVLFEMLSGRRPFSGSDISETLASVIKDEPAWSVLPADLPEPLRRLLRRCLEKDPRRRLSSIGDARLELDEPAGPAPATAGPATPRPASRAGWIAAAVMTAVALGVVLWTGWSAAPVPAPLMRMTVQAPPDHRLFRDPANTTISPDGTKVAFITGASRGDGRLWIRALESLDAIAVEDSLGAQLPFWSPDSGMVGFFASGQLKIVSAAGGRPQIVAAAPDGRGASWGANGDIVFAAASAGPLSRVSANGGAVTAATELRAADGETGHRFPWFLPDGTHFVFAALPSKANQYSIYSAALGSAARDLVVTAETAALYADPGYLIYSRQGVLVAHPFDPQSRTVSGEAMPIGDMPGEMNLEFSAGYAASVSRMGHLVYLSAAQSRSRLAWLDQTGREISTVNVPSAPYVGVGLSRDETRAIVVQLASPQSSLWLADLVRGGLSPVAPATSWHSGPIWSKDDRHIVFGGDRLGPVDLYIRDVSTGIEELLYQSESLFKYPATWSPDGRTIVFTDLHPETGNDLWTVEPFGDRTPVPFLRTKALESHGAISPDGRWMAYQSDQAGRPDVYVQPFPGGGSPTRITTSGTLDWGLWWKRDGSQLLILGANLDLLLADIRLGATVTAGEVRVVGKLKFPIVAAGSVDATADLSRLLAAIPELADGARSMTVVLNWREAIGR